MSHDLPSQSGDIQEPTEPKTELTPEELYTVDGLHTMESSSKEIIRCVKSFLGDSVDQYTPKINKLSSDERQALADAGYELAKVLGRLRSITDKAEK